MLGERVLSDKDLKMLLPGYQDIFTQIEQMRNDAYVFNKCRENQTGEYLYNSDSNHYRNVISILGSRGTGKTSILLTLADNLKRADYSNINCISDIILPMIDPDKIGDNSDVLGWIIDSFSSELEHLKSLQFKCRKCYCNHDLNPESWKAREEQWKKLIEKYEELKKSFIRRLGDYSQLMRNNYSGFNDFKNESYENISNDRNLSNVFNGFIDSIIHFKRACHNLNNPKNLDTDTLHREVLIFIFFDDIDMNSEHCNEVLSTIHKFLCHSNIVVIVSGHYKFLLEETTLSFLRKISGIDLNKLDRMEDEDKKIFKCKNDDIRSPFYLYRIH